MDRGGSDGSGSFAGGRASRSGSRKGLRLASGSGDLIEDIHRQHRRRVLKRAAQLTALAVVLLMCGVAFKVFADRRARADALDQAAVHLQRGTVDEMSLAAQVLGLSLERDPDDPATQALHGLVRGHIWLEFGVGEDEARQALQTVPASPPARAVADAMLAYGEARVDDAARALDAFSPGEDTVAMVVREAHWLRGHVAVASTPGGSPRAGSDPAAPRRADAIAAALTDVVAWLEEHPDDVAMQRLRAWLELHGGDPRAALASLDAARDLSDTHMGLAADEALYNALLRQELAGVASVADQLIDRDYAGLSVTDRAHAVLARAVVHVQSGEAADGLARLDEAWSGLEPWNVIGRRLAVVTSLEAGDTTRVEAWAGEAGLPAGEADIYRAWGVFLAGDIMEALARLETLDQAHPRVAYVQGLALVEQGRWTEAAPWLSRADSLLPGRIEIEVARARADSRLQDQATALRKLQALAEEEPYAPRAWTGLGEAELLQASPDYDAAERALRRAIEREPLPAEAMLQLGQVELRRSPHDPTAEVAALRLFERAAAVHPKLPRYRVAAALHLAKLGLLERAVPALKALVEEPGVGAEVPLALAEAKLRGDVVELDAVEALLATAAERGADAKRVELLRLQVLVRRGAEDKDALSEAATKLTTRVEGAPSDVGARVLLLRVLLAQRDKKAAETTLRRGLSVVEDGHKARLLYEWARMEARTGKKRVAAPRSRRAWVEMLAEDRPAVELLDTAELAVRMWLFQKRERIAITIATRLTERLDYHAQAWTLRAKAELADGETRDARDSVTKALELDPEHAAAHELHGHCLLRFGYRDEAKKAYAKAVALAEGTAAQKTYQRNLDRL